MRCFGPREQLSKTIVRPHRGRSRVTALGVEPGGLISIDRVTVFGASCPFRLVLANVPSPNPQKPFAAGDNLLGSGC
jgi:hypothetical protein